MYLRSWRVVGMILMGDRSIVWFLVSGLPTERIKFGFLKDYAIRGINLPCPEGRGADDMTTKSATNATWYVKGGQPIISHTSSNYWLLIKQFPAISVPLAPFYISCTPPPDSPPSSPTSAPCPANPSQSSPALVLAYVIHYLAPSTFLFPPWVLTSTTADRRSHSPQIRRCLPRRSPFPQSRYLHPNRRRHQPVWR